MHIPSDGFIKSNISWRTQDGNSVGVFFFSDKAKKKNKCCLKAPVPIHVSLCVCLEMADSFFFSSIFFLLFCQKKQSFYKNEKSKGKLSQPAQSDSNLVSSRLPSQFSAPFLVIQTNCTGQQWSQQVVKKGKKKKKRKKHCISDLILKPWRALRQNIILLAQKGKMVNFMLDCFSLVWILMYQHSEFAF